MLRMLKDVKGCERDADMLKDVEGMEPTIVLMLKGTL